MRVDVFPTTKEGAPILDLTQQDFDVLESGTPQKIEQFEHVMIRAAAQATRVDPNTLREMRTMLENPRARVFVTFLDVGHVTIEGSHRIRQPLTDTLNRRRRSSHREAVDEGDQRDVCVTGRVLARSHAARELRRPGRVSTDARRAEPRECVVLSSQPAWAGAIRLADERAAAADIGSTVGTPCTSTCSAI